MKIYTLEVFQDDVLKPLLVGIFSSEKKAEKYRKEYLTKYKPQYLDVSIFEIEKDFPVKERELDLPFPY